MSLSLLIIKALINRHGLISPYTWRLTSVAFLVHAVDLEAHFCTYFLTILCQVTGLSLKFQVFCNVAEVSEVIRELGKRHPRMAHVVAGMLHPGRIPVC